MITKEVAIRMLKHQYKNGHITKEEYDKELKYLLGFEEK